MRGEERRLVVDVGLLLIDDNPGNLDAPIHFIAFELELQQQAMNGTGQCHKIALTVKLHKSATQGTRMDTHLHDTIILQAFRQRST